MARTVDEAAHARRRGEFLDAAERLIGTKGYEAMSVRDVLDEACASRGAFYHYFDSKHDLLWGMIERTGEALLVRLRSAIEASGPDALAQLRGYFRTLAELKLSQRGISGPMLRIWQSAGNALIRQQVRADIIERHTPLLAAIVRAGAAQGVFNARCSEQTGRLLITLVQDLNEEMARLFFAFEAGEVGDNDIKHTAETYSSAVERILGLPAGSVVVVEPSALLAWFDPKAERNGV